MPGTVAGLVYAQSYDGEVFAHLEPLIRSAPPLVAKDHLGVVNRLWTVTDSATVSKVIGAMGPKDVYIADGQGNGVAAC